MALGALQNHVRRNNGYGAFDVKFPIKTNKAGGEKLFHFGFLLHCKGRKEELRGPLYSSFTYGKYSSGEKEGLVLAWLAGEGKGDLNPARAQPTGCWG